jgi:hypothetical protein
MSTRAHAVEFLTRIVLNGKLETAK